MLNRYIYKNEVWFEFPFYMEFSKNIYKVSHNRSLFQDDTVKISKTPLQLPFHVVHKSKVKNDGFESIPIVIYDDNERYPV